MTDLRDDHDEHAPAEELRTRAAMLTSSERPLLIEAMGGPLGMAESSIPSIAFVIAITAGAEIKTGALIAVGLALALGIARALRRQTVQFALTGVIGVGISAYIANHTGKAKNFFLPTFIANIAYAAICLISVAIGRPFIGYVVEGIAGDQGDWRNDPEKMRRFRIASLMWGGLFLLRLVVQLPLYWTDSLVALGTAKIAMGIPLFALGIWLTWLMLRADVQRPGSEPAADGPAATATRDDA